MSCTVIGTPTWWDIVHFLCAQESDKHCTHENKIHDYKSIKRGIISFCGNADGEYIICCRQLLFFFLPTQSLFSFLVILLRFPFKNTYSLHSQSTCVHCPYPSSWVVMWSKLSPWEFIIRFVWASEKRNTLSFSSFFFSFLNFSSYSEESSKDYWNCCQPVFSPYRKILPIQYGFYTGKART